MNPSAYDTAASLYGQAASTYQDLLSSDSPVLQNINSYINPYYAQVRDSVLGVMGTNFQNQVNAIGDQAIASGAFGGSRHGVAEGVARGKYNENVADVSATMAQDAWNNATSLSQQDIDTKQAAAGRLAGLGTGYFNAGQQIMSDQLSQGTAQQSLLQAILDQGYSMYKDYMSNPADMLNMYNALLSSDPRNAAITMSGTSTTTPGLFDYLSLGAQTLGGLMV